MGWLPSKKNMDIGLTTFVFKILMFLTMSASRL